MIYLNVLAQISKSSTSFLLKVFSIISLSILLGVVNFCSPAKFQDFLQIIKRETKQLYAGLIDQTRVQKIDQLVKKHIKWGRFNGNILVVSEGILIYHRSFGMANVKEQKKLEKDSVFQIASLSKQFTAMAVMMLEEKGLISYNDKVTKYLLNFPYPETTIYHLLNHTAGLPNYMWLVEHKWPGKTPPYNDDILDLLAQYKQPLNFKPGTRFNYSNTGYVILALIVERVSGVRFHAFIEKNIFQPLKMKNSFVYSSIINHQKKGKIAQNYYRRRGRYYRVSDSIHDGVVGDKGVYATIEDLLKWDHALYSHRLVSREIQQKAFTRLVLKNHYKWHYGFGFRIKGDNDNKWVYHFGRWDKYHTYIGRFLNKQSTIIVLSNMGNKIENIVRGIEYILSEPESKDNLTGP